MLSTLVRTKYTLPPLRRALIARPRLLEKLDRARRKPLTVVIAAAGFGKTTLVREWCALQSGPCAWLALDVEDNDPARFFAYLLAALQTATPALQESLDAQLEAAPLSPPALFTNIINALSVRAEEIFLVLDDYHWIENDALHTALEFFVEHLPANAHLVVTARADPPWALARWRARNQLNELRASDLRWTTAEAAQFLNEAMGIRLTDAQIEKLQKRTEGWIAGLQLAALALGEHADAAAFIESFSGSQRYIITYLADEVLKRQPAAWETFLLETSVLERFNAELCRAVTGVDAAQTQLNELYARNLFLIPLDEQGEWYRYHFLFAEVLRARLKLKYAAPEILELHRRASEWFENRNLGGEAMEHALAARDWERAARLLSTYAEHFWRRGEMATIERWLGGFPPEVIANDARLLLVQAMTLILTAPSQFARIDALIQRAETLSAATDAGSNELRARLLAVAGANSSNQGNAARTIDLTARALRELAPANLFWRTLTHVNLGIALLTRGEPRPAAKALEQAVELARQSDLLYLGFFGQMHLAYTRLLHGQLRRARTLFSEALADLEAHHLEHSPVAGYLYGGYGKLLYEWNMLPESRTLLERARALIQAKERLWVLIEIEMDLARVARAQRNAAEARQLLTHVEELLRDERVAWMRPIFAAVQARADLQDGKFDRVNVWMRQAEITALEPVPFAREFEALTLARVWLARGQTEKALGLLAHIHHAAQTHERNAAVIKTEMLRALAYAQAANSARARVHLTNALQMAHAERFVRLFVDEGEAMRKMLGDWRLEIGDLELRDYVEGLLAAFSESTASVSDKSKIEIQKSKILFEPLSDRELQVLRLIAAGASNQQIADKLVIALPTVKRHISNIYGKFGVTSRTQALVRAQELKLL
jgi:LuxR family maltose regulon positive regulatory protein